MKRIIIVSFLISVFIISKAQNRTYEIKTFEDSIAYSIGCNIGNNLRGTLKKDSLVLNHDIIAMGVRDALNGDESMVFSSETNKYLMDKFRKFMEEKIAARNARLSKATKEEGLKFLEENKKKPGVITTPSGLQYKVIKEGTGNKPTMESTVTVHYEGRFIDGRVFDSSYEQKNPVDFSLTNVIKGFSEGLMLMKEGSIYELYFPSDLGYGDAGTPGIPGGSTLIFKVELIKVK